MASPTKNDAAPLLDLNGLNARIHGSNQYTDMKITCQGKTFEVHRPFICLQSKPLAAAMNDDWKEAKTGNIDLEEKESADVEKAIEFLYCHKYTVSVEMPDDPKSMILNTRLYVFGDKYDIPLLKLFAKEQYEASLRGKLQVASFVASFVTSFKIMFEELPAFDSQLKDIAFNAAARNIKILTCASAFEELYKGNEDISWGVLKCVQASLIDTKALPTTPGCPSGCHHSTWIKLVRDSSPPEYRCRNCDRSFYSAWKISLTPLRTHSPIYTTKFRIVKVGE